LRVRVRTAEGLGECRDVLFSAAHCQSSSVDLIAVLVVVFMECMVINEGNGCG
jgi:hypothetical protein